MPSWTIHLAVAKKVNKKLNLDKDTFYIGNLLPDVDYNSKVTRKETHIHNYPCPECPKEILPNLKDFLKNYKKDIKNSSLLLGYYSHLLTDYFYNNYIFTNCWLQDEKKDVIGVKLNNGKKIYTNDLRSYKHHDLGNYGKYLLKIGYVELPKSFNEENDLKLLKDNFFTYEDTVKRIKYLNTKFIKDNKYNITEKIFGLKYIMLTKEKLDELFEECSKYVLENIESVIDNETI